MGSFSIMHLLIILVIVLVFFGPRRLPDLGKGLGEAIRGFKKGLDGSEIDVTDSTKRESIKSAEEGDTPPQKTKDRNEA